MMKAKNTIVSILLSLAVLIPSGSSYAADEYAMRFPTKTAMAVVTPSGGDTTYLRLDTTNDPLTNDLDIDGGITDTRNTGSTLFDVLTANNGGLLKLQSYYHIASSSMKWQFSYGANEMFSINYLGTVAP